MILDREDILDRNRNSQERLRQSSGYRFIRDVGLGKRVRLIDAQERAYLRIDALDLVETCLNHLAHRGFAPRELRMEIRNGQLIQHAYSTIFGTRKRPLAFAGALRMASSCGIDGRTSSGRVMFTSGTACAVGSTFETS